MGPLSSTAKVLQRSFKNTRVCGEGTAGVPSALLHNCQCLFILSFCMSLFETLCMFLKNLWKSLAHRDSTRWQSRPPMSSPCPSLHLSTQTLRSIPRKRLAHRICALDFILCTCHFFCLEYPFRSPTDGKSVKESVSGQCTQICIFKRKRMDWCQGASFMCHKIHCQDQGHKAFLEESSSAPNSCQSTEMFQRSSPLDLLTLGKQLLSL